VARWARCEATSAITPLAWRRILRERLADVVVTGPGGSAALGLAQRLAAGRRLCAETIGDLPNRHRGIRCHHA